jgi:hypothetical protein
MERPIFSVQAFKNHFEFSNFQFPMVDEDHPPFVVLQIGNGKLAIGNALKIPAADTCQPPGHGSRRLEGGARRKLRFRHKRNPGVPRLPGE